MKKPTPDGQEDNCKHCGEYITYDLEFNEWEGYIGDNTFSALCHDFRWHEPIHHRRIKGKYYFNYDFKDYLNGVQGKTRG